MNGIDHLLADHERLRPEIDRLRRTAEDLADRGEDAVPDAAPVLVEIGRWMGTTLELHAQKEDDALFPAVEAVLGEGGPTPAFRSEHSEIKGLGEQLHRVLDELEAAHPLIDEKGAELRDLDVTTAGAERLQTLAQEIADLVEDHFDKEEQMLFPMCRQVLSEEVLAEVGHRMVELSTRAA